MKKKITKRRQVGLHIVSSDIERYFLSACYNVNVNKFPITGYPRNDRLIQSLGNKNFVKRYLCEALKLNCNFSKVILYAPTHRDASTLGETDLTIPKFFPFSDLETSLLNDFLENNEAIILLRTHRVDGLFGGDRKNIDQSIEKLPRIKFCPHNEVPDINEILPVIDLLWTDYSGIYLDYLLCEKPIIFIPYDLKEYEKIRGFLFDYNLFTPGPKVNTFQDLIKESVAALNSPEIYNKDREYLKKLFHKYDDGKACKRIIDLLKTL